jgi:uncharacterized membrane protein
LRLSFIFRDLRIMNKYIMGALKESAQDEQKVVKIQRGQKMNFKKIHGKTVFVVALFIISALILIVKLLNSTPIQIYVDENKTVVTQIPGFFTTTDAIILIVTSIVLGISGAYLLLPVSVEKPAEVSVLGERKERWEKISKALKDDERKIYKAILDSDGFINQSEIAEKTGLSKSNVSRSLDLLESKGLVERKRRGMGNIVLLKS